MQPALMRALGSPEEQEKASQLANLGGSKKSASASTSCPMGGDSTAAPGPNTRSQKSNRSWKIAVRRRAFHRLAELYRLATFYGLHGIPMEVSTWGVFLRQPWAPASRLGFR